MNKRVCKPKDQWSDDDSTLLTSQQNTGESFLLKYVNLMCTIQWTISKISALQKPVFMRIISWNHLTLVLINVNNIQIDINLPSD
jgi:hypothetical protein